MTSPWQPYREPLRTTLIRTGLIALAIGAVSARSWERWPMATVVMLWPAFGGHWVEVWFLNWLRPRLALERSVQVAARLGVWFVGGIVLSMGMVATGFEGRPAWWVAGLAFIGIELVAHVFLQLRGLPSFYNGRG
jgi:hypothetical protein